MRPLITFAFIAFATIVSAQMPDPAQLVKQGRALVDEGKYDEGGKFLQQALAANPKSFEAHLGLGSLLDLQGKYAEARAHLTEAISHAPAGQARNQALNAMAISYAFEAKADEAMKQLEPVYRQQIVEKNFAGAAGTANAIGRIYLESGDAANARRWYDDGYEQAKQITGLPQAEQDLWQMRWLHALARITAREARPEEARMQLTVFERLMKNRGKLQEDNEIYRYLLGYVAIYGRDHVGAIEELTKANQQDPFILYLLGRAYQMKGDHATAQRYFQQVLSLHQHTINTAFARPYARANIK